MLPVVGEPLGPPEVYGDDRLFVVVGDARRRRREPRSTRSSTAGHPVVRVPFGGGADLVVDLGAQVLLWEVATALCGAGLGINPFDQPDVAAAKAATQQVLDAGAVPDVPSSRCRPSLAGVGPGDYVAIHAYVDPGSGVVDDLERVRVAHPRPAPRRHDRRARPPLPALDRPAPQGRAADGRVPPGRRAGDPDDDVAIPGAPFGFATLHAGPGGRRPGHPARPWAAGRSRVDLDDLLDWKIGDA